MARGGNSRHRQMREEERGRWKASNAACHICGQDTIDWDAEANTPDAFELDHVLSVKAHPELEFEPSNRKPSHHRCNRNKGAGALRPGLGITSEAW